MKPETKEIPSQKPEDSKQNQAPQLIPEAEMKIMKHISHKTAEHMQEAKRNLTAQIMSGVGAILGWAGMIAYTRPKLFDFRKEVSEELTDRLGLGANPGRASSANA